MNDSFDLERYKEETIDYLASCFARDIVDTEDYERRITLVNGASTQRDVDDVVFDLVPQNHGSVYREERRDMGPPVDSKVVTIFSERHLDESALTDRYTTTLTVFGTTTLDLSRMRMTGDLHIHVVTVMGEIRLMLPYGVRVRNSITPVLAEVSDRNRDHAPQTGATITLTGVAVMAEVKIKRV